MLISRHDTDKFLVISSVILLTVGVVMVYSTSYIFAMRRFGDGYFFFKRHVFFACVGTLAFICAYKLPLDKYRKLAYPILILTAIGLVAIFIPHVGFVAGGARRWVRLGPLTFQPSEPAKLAVVIFLAYSLSGKAEKIKNFATGFLPNIVIPGIIIGLVLLEPDFGTSVCIASVVLIMIFIAGARLKHLGMLALAVVPGAVVVIMKFSYMMSRIKVYLDPWADPAGKGFQMVQSFIAFGNGGLHGVGLGEGMQKLFYLPEAHTDFIMSVVGEEFGLIGVFAIVACFLLLFYCGISIAGKARDLHAKYLAYGVTFMIVLQAALNMGVVLGVLPPKGLPLPFISYGGSALMTILVAMGLVQSVILRHRKIEF